MHIFFEKGICLQDGIKEISLDPSKPTPGSIVTHAHMDHLTKGALMTHETLSIMKIRLGSGNGRLLAVGREDKYHGFKVKFHEAGHTFGSVMVETEGVLYTGDFNPEGGLTCGIATPRHCETLIIESTYGKPEFTFPPKREVERDLLSWTSAELSKSSVAFGAIEFGKAQELIALLNTRGYDVVVSDNIAQISDVYKSFGYKLRYTRLSGLSEGEKQESRIFIVPSYWLKDKKPREFNFFKKLGGSQALVSGWCGIFNFTRQRNLTAQFPLSDHGDFDSLIEFTESCKPSRVLTVGSHSHYLAKEIRDRLGLESYSLQQRRRRTRDLSH